MTYTLVLLTSLIGLSGFIAYAGDRLGTYFGKKRLSMFGWRPKRTGQVIGIAAGIFIMLSTLGVLALVFRGATSVVLRAEDAARELTHARTQLAALQKESDALRQSVDTLTAERDGAQREVRVLNTQIATQLEPKIQLAEIKLAEKQQELIALEANNQLLSDDAAQLQQRVQELNRQILTNLRPTLELLEGKLAQAEASLTETQQQLVLEEAAAQHARNLKDLLEVENRRLQEQITQAEAELAQKQSDLTATQTELRALRTQIDLKDTDLSHAQEQITLAQTHIDALQAQLDTQQASQALVIQLQDALAKTSLGEELQQIQTVLVTAVSALHLQQQLIDNERARGRNTRNELDVLQLQNTLETQRLTRRIQELEEQLSISRVQRDARVPELSSP